ncbi:hypothetical protein [Paenibacillus sp. YPG26]|uniref:hypothetical protein n=1 Tax=Paenibacillus sp. YPG26 TaxID=2878915 RepID=UPI00203BED52|nr:hypothetical protein [Paenibacillus sp. YPG26]USB31931.1 hypothetical protein LDO05_11305 [Paenibacillus sp. YPG26]
MKSRIVGISPERLWEHLQSPATFQMVSAPLMAFRSRDTGGYPPRWAEGSSYPLRMYMLGVVPLGHHTILFKRVDHSARRISTDEHGLLLKFWQHTMEVIPDSDPEAVLFRDTLELKNGLLTIPTYLGVYAFFAYRHWRMKRLIRNGSLR